MPIPTRIKVHCLKEWREKQQKIRTTAFTVSRITAVVRPHGGDRMEIIMKRILKAAAALLLLCAVLMSLASCMPIACTVEFVYGNGEEDSSVDAMTHSYLQPPKAPTRTGYRFSGWYKDEECTRPFDFESPLTGSETLYAGWIVDYQGFSEAIAARALSANVKVKAVYYTSTLGIYANKQTESTGSGVIYKELDGYYYILSNNHVVEDAFKHNMHELYVYDAFGEKYDATLVYSDPAYDLALIKFKAGEAALSVLNIADDNPAINETVAAMGNPKAQYNTTTYGNIKAYKTIEVEEGTNSDKSDVTFKVLWHTAYTNHGSSGGALINYELEIVGINYATGSNKDGTFTCGFSIPAVRVKEFLLTAEANIS